jgi:hypothetical protein
MQANGCRRAVTGRHGAMLARDEVPAQAHFTASDETSRYGRQRTNSFGLPQAGRFLNAPLASSR